MPILVMQSVQVHQRTEPNRLRLGRIEDGEKRINWTRRSHNRKVDLARRRRLVVNVCRT